MTILQKARQGEIVLFYRHDSPDIYCRVKLPGKGWLQRSTKKKDKVEALHEAERLHHEVRFRHQMGLMPKSTTFAHACRLYEKSLLEEVELGFRNARHLRDYLPIVENYLRPYFGRRKIDEIRNKDIAQYYEWRRAYWMKGPGSKKDFIEYERNGKTIRRPRPKPKAPSHNTFNVENVVLRSIFDTAVKNDLLRSDQVPIVTMDKRQKKEKNRRPAFTKEEYDQLCQFLFTWMNDKTADNRERRQLLRNYVIFLAHSGLRPGTETDGLLWKHVREAKTKSGHMRFVLSVDGKTKKRHPVVSGPGYTALQQIKINAVAEGYSIYEHQHVFSLPDGTHVPNDSLRQLFRKALSKANLLFDEYGNQRALYSLRHTYATFQLLYNRVSIYTLVEQMGTSVKMIEEHYGHLRPELAIDELTERSVDDVLNE
jgi:integrase